MPSSTHEPIFADLLTLIRDRAAQAPDLDSLQRFVVDLLPSRLPHYNWTGFYMLDPTAPDTLVLGPFHGAPTTHVRIPVSEGICGAAVAQAQTIVIDDVHADSRYLACSLETSSEIVVPIRAHGTIVGEIDIDSHQPSAFSPADRLFLEDCAAVLGRFIERAQPRAS